MTLPEAVTEALRLIESDVRVVGVEIECAPRRLGGSFDPTWRLTAQYRFIKDKQAELRYRIEHRTRLMTDNWSNWVTTPGFDVADVLGQWQVRAITGKDALYL